MSKTRFITIEGPTGVGKTTLATKIAEKFGWHLALEIFEDNPFLGKYYGDGENCAFQMEMFFLTSRYRQFTQMKQNYLQREISTVADYHFIKNLVFAQLTLSNEELNIFKDIYHILFQNFPPTDLIIFLNASVETIQYRLAKRGRDFEQNLNVEYLQNLCNSFRLEATRFKNLFPSIRQITVDTDQIDFVTNQEHLEAIFYQINSLLELKNFDSANISKFRRMNQWMRIFS